MGENGRYTPFGGYRTGETNESISDRGYTGHQQNDPLGLIYMNARYYLPDVGRFLSADTIIPDPYSSQNYNRYTYALNNPIKYVDPSGHCVFIPPYDTAICLGLFLLTLTGDSQQPLPEPNYPINNTGEYICNSPLPTCFGDTVYLKDFEGYGEENPISIEEFEEFSNKIAEDLHSHELGIWPGLFSGRGVYDTPFYNGGESERRTGNSDAENGYWPADQQVCIETIRCSGRSEINYIAQGMWGAATGESYPTSKAMVWSWKLWEYQEFPSEDTLFWLQYGYDYYQNWLKEQEGSID